MAKSKLTKQRRLFVDEYLRLWNGAEAARRAGYSEKGARQQASYLLTIPDIQNEIESRLAEVHMSADEALALVAEIARGDLGDFMNDFGMVDISQARKEGKTKLIKKWEVKTVTINGKEDDREIHTEKIELYPRDAALDKVLRVHGKYKDSLDVNVRSYSVEIEDD